MEVYQNPKGHEFGLFTLYEEIKKLSTRNTRWLRGIAENNAIPPASIISELKSLYEKWLEIWLLDYNNWIQKERIGGSDVCPSISIFVELCRTHFILKFKQIKEESQKVLESQDLNQNLSILFAMKSLEYFDTHRSDFKWEVPIFQFKQSDIINALIILTEKLNQIPWAARGELTQAADILYTRNAVFFCTASSTDILDVKAMRVEVPGQPMRPNVDYLTFTSIYFNAIQRRLFYADLYKPMDQPRYPDEAVKRVKEWVEKDLCSILDVDQFDEFWKASYEESYHFPGDSEWFVYKYPDVPPQTGPILDCFRKDYSKKYYADYRVSMDVVLASVDVNSHTGYGARIFVINVVNNYIFSHLGYPFRDSCVIENENLEKKDFKFIRNAVPYIVQVFSRYCCYYKKQVYYTDSLYETLTCWFYLLKIHYHSTALDVNLSELVDWLIDGKKRENVITIY